jgi:hypothetical protein
MGNIFSSPSGNLRVGINAEPMTLRLDFWTNTSNPPQIIGCIV